MTDFNSNINNILEVKNLTKNFKEFSLNNISFSLEKGYIMGLIGPNGSGKTTLIKILMGLMKADSGEVLIFNLDNNDKKAIHVLGSIGSEVIAYTRLFKSGDYFDTASIGRVVVNPKFRRLALGKQLMQKSISALKDLFKEDTITISAQCYLIEFYKSLGFLAVGDEYLEDNIPHVKMIRG